MTTRDEAIEQIVRETEAEGGDGLVIKAIADLIYEIEEDPYNSLYLQATVAMCVARFARIFGVENVEQLLQESLNALGQMRAINEAQKMSETMSKH